MTVQDAVDERFMRRCIQLALNSEGRTYPNPMVGAVVVRDGVIIGEGWHRKAGSPHAEVNAIASVRDPEALRHSTIYVSLEPCAHFGRTPPCADLIIRSGIPRVVVGCRDSFAKVDGKGIMKLREAGIEVKVGILEEECRWLNRRFFTIQEKGRPYVILKWAETADSYMGGMRDGRPTPVMISNAEALMSVHRQRTTEDAILVGIGTVVSDDPRLTPRLWKGPAPLRIVIDPRGEIPTGSKVLTDGGQTLVVGGKENREVGTVKFVNANITPDNLALTAVMAAAGEGVSSIIVEGGAHTLRHFIESRMWDEAFIYQSDKMLGGGIEAPQLKLAEMMEVKHLGDCTLRHFRNRDASSCKYFKKI